MKKLYPKKAYNQAKKKWIELGEGEWVWVGESGLYLSWDKPDGGVFSTCIQLHPLKEEDVEY
jgi:hypothetical protein